MHAVNCHMQPSYRKDANKKKDCDSLVSGDHDEKEECTCGLHEALQIVKDLKNVCFTTFYECGEKMESK